MGIIAKVLISDFTLKHRLVEHKGNLANFFCLKKVVKWIAWSHGDASHAILGGNL